MDLANGCREIIRQIRDFFKCLGRVIEPGRLETIERLLRAESLRESPVAKSEITRASDAEYGRSCSARLQGNHASGLRRE